MVTDVTSLRNQLTEYQQEYRKTITQILPVDRIYVTFLDTLQQSTEYLSFGNNQQDGLHHGFQSKPLLHDM